MTAEPRLTPPTFVVRDVPVYGDVILSPMAGFSDQPYRLLCREYGSAMSYTGFVSAAGIVRAPARLRHLLAFAPAERPVVFQLVGHDEVILEEAARRLEQLGPDIIDVNMGCPAKQVTARGAGAALLKDPAKIGRIFARLTRAVSVPVSGKIRLGWDDESLNYREVATRLAENGASLIAVHGRTRRQTYKDRVNWDAIAEIKQAVAIPIIGNGDVACAADMARLKQHAGCDGVMIGRAALGNPWIFQGRDRDGVPLAETAGVIARHLALMLECYGREHGLLLFRKHVVNYACGLPQAARVKARLLTCTDPEAFIALLRVSFSSPVGTCA